jgi:hypothetical protein
MSRKKKRRPRKGTRRGPRRQVSAPPRAPTQAEVLADQIIGLVLAKAPSLGGKRGDAAGQVMFGAFVYGFRRFVAIRQLAGRDEGAEALILARSLLSIVARAVYVDAPEDLAERRMRYEQYLVKDLRDRLKMVEDLLATGFDVEDTRPGLSADPALADEALRLAIMIYGTLLENSERAVGHGLHDAVYELSRPVLAAADEDEGSSTEAAS